MNIYQVEPGIERVRGNCGTCGHETRVFRGVVSDQDGPFAVYLASYSVAHPEMGVSLAIGLRGWTDPPDPAVRECVVLDWRRTETGPGCMVRDAPASRWATSEILGQMLTRDEALRSGRAREAFAVGDAIWAADARISAALGLPSNRS